MDWLPAHKCGLYLEHNAHKDVYESVADYYEEDDFINGSFAQCISADEVWSLQWYPNTPVGFHRICAPTLDSLRLYFVAESD